MRALYAQYVFLIACLFVSRHCLPITTIAITIAVQIRYHQRLQLQFQLHSKLLAFLPCKSLARVQLIETAKIF
ncbi:hypothetical protein NA56DRAFT_707194 [Hyaloscypha hepaticicola]|uniref:Uncharacterized protein n=1 Tax=Hyaloscypha hepaticicola TaxID=2082293 RepID=A0A2J6PUU0_9HELO|nr:hypothetical protein NA56DRAFT_707194 [Hyaloscypha hepaticicola]